MSALYYFPGVTVPGAVTGGPAIDSNSRLVVVPLVDGDAAYAAALYRGLFVKNPEVISFHLVDNSSGATWGSPAVLSIRRSNNPNGRFEDLVTPVSLGKTTRFGDIDVGNLNAAYLCAEFTHAFTSTVEKAFDMYVFIKGV